MTKITKSKLERARFLKAYKGKVEVQGKLVGYMPPEPRKIVYIDAEDYLGRDIKLQVFLSPGETYNSKRRYKIEMNRRKKMGFSEQDFVKHVVNTKDDTKVDKDNN